MLIIGKAGSGKDTFASMFPQLKRYAFGDEVKKITKICQIDGAKAAHDYVLAKTGILDSTVYPILEYAATHHEGGKQRHILQVVGQGFRNIEPNFWVNLVIGKIATDGNPPHIITDCRYRNEFDAFKDEISVFLYASRKTRLRRLKARDGTVSWKDLSHRSETEINEFCDLCTYRIDNSRDSLQELRHKAEAIMRKEGELY